MKVRVALSEVGSTRTTARPTCSTCWACRRTETLADLSPEAVKTRTFDTLLQMRARGARRRPLVFVIEDLHWVDWTSEEFLASLADSLPAEPMMLLATYRPGYQPPWTGRSYATQPRCPGSPPTTAGSSCGRCSRPGSRTRPRSSSGGARGTRSSSRSSRGSSRGQRNRVHARPRYGRGRADGAHRPAPRRRQERPPDRVRPRPGVLHAAAETRGKARTSMHSWSSSSASSSSTSSGIETSRTTPSSTPSSRRWPTRACSPSGAGPFTRPPPAPWRRSTEVASSRSTIGWPTTGTGPRKPSRRSSS